MIIQNGTNWICSPAKKIWKKNINLYETMHLWQYKKSCKIYSRYKTDPIFFFPYFTWFNLFLWFMDFEDNIYCFSKFNFLTTFNKSIIKWHLNINIKYKFIGLKLSHTQLEVVVPPNYWAPTQKGFWTRAILKDLLMDPTRNFGDDLDASSGGRMKVSVVGF